MLKKNILKDCGLLCECLRLHTLLGTDVYNIKFPAGSADYTRITAKIAAETNDVYSQGQYAVGQPCN